MNADLHEQLHAAFTRHEHDPRDLATVDAICDMLIALEREDELLPWVDRALLLGSRHPEIYAMRAHVLDLHGRHAEAVETRLRDPFASGHFALAQVRLGYSLMMAGELARAIELFEAARGHAADEPALLAVATQLLGEAMLKGGNPQGFTHWINRNESGDAGSYRPADIPPWTRESGLRNARVLVTHQLGFGDNFLLGACLADWQAAGASVLLTCDPQIHALMQASLPGCEVLSGDRPLRPHARLPHAMLEAVDAFAPDVHATLLDLPLLRAARSSTGYVFQPYMRAPQAKQRIAAQWAKQLRARRPRARLVGLFWDCHQRHAPELGATMRSWAARRSLPLEAVNRLVMDTSLTERVQFVNLHHPVTQPAAGMPAGNVEQYEPGVYFFDDTAACVGELDAVFAVDSAVANLAVMMGKRTCVPVNTSGDWRWGTRGTSSPWIDKVTVLRQTHEGNWDAVVNQAAKWLAAL